MSVRSGEAATISITLDAEPDEVRWSLENETGTRLVSEGLAPGSAIDGNTVTLTIEGTNNTLSAGQRRGLRMIRLRYRAEDLFAGWREADHAYDVISVDGELVVQGNSFVTYNEALLLAREMSGVGGFDAATRAARITALIEAWRALVKLRYDVTIDEDRRMRRVLDFPGANPGDLSDMPADVFLTLEPRFVSAVKRAQVVEAIERLSDRPVDEARKNGLMSSSIGEVSQMYRPGRPFDMGLAKRTLMELRGFVSFSPRIGRG